MSRNSEVDAAPDFDFNESVDNGFNRLQLKQKLQPKRAVPRSTTRAMLSTDFGVLRENEMNSFDTSPVSKKSSSRQYAAFATMQNQHSATMPLRVLSKKEVYQMQHKDDMTLFRANRPHPEPNYSYTRRYANIAPGYKTPMILEKLAELEKKIKILDHYKRMGMV